MAYTYEYPRPMVTVDCVIFGYDTEELKILLIQRGTDPFEGKWALPGGFMRMEEDLEDAARRELLEETGARDVYLEQLYTFGTPGRDPRGRVVTVAYYALVALSSQHIEAATDARNAAWHPMANLPELAFDHEKILDYALERLKAKVRYKPIGFELLPEKFTLTQIQQLYETILQTPLDKRNFRRKLLSFGLLIPLDEYATGLPHRAPQLFKFDMGKYQELEKKGFLFEI